MIRSFFCILTSVILYLFTGQAVAQEEIVKYYSANWKELPKNRGKYIREIEVVNDSLFIVRDYHRRGKKLIMRGDFKSIDPLIEHGYIEYYDEKRNKMIEGEYRDGEQSGIWIINNYHYIEYAELDYNFSVDYHNRFEQDKDSAISAEIVSESFPEFPGGESALREYLGTYSVNPYKMYLRMLNVKAVVGFTISKSGIATDPFIIESSGLPDYDKELIRLIKYMPAWKPGTQNNEPVDVFYSLSKGFHYISFY